MFAGTARDMTIQGNPGMTLTCLLAGVMVFQMTLPVSCNPHISTLTTQTADQSKLQTSSGYAPAQISPVSLVWRRRRTGPHGAPGYPQASPPTILVVSDKLTSREPSIFVFDQADNEEAPRLWSRRQANNEEVPRPWSRRQANNEADVVIWRLAPNNQVAPSVWNEGTRRHQRALLQPAHAPGLMTSSTATLMMLQKKKTKNTREIPDAMYKRYGSSLDTSENSVFKEQQMLAKLLLLKDILKKQHRETAEDRSLNDIEGAWSDDHKYSWSDDEPVHSHVPGPTDPTLDQQPMASVNDHKSRDGRDGAEMYLPNLETLGYSNDRKWSPHSDASVGLSAPFAGHAPDALDKTHTSVGQLDKAHTSLGQLDKAHTSLGQLGSDRNDGHVTSSDLQYSTLTNVFHPGPGVTRQENHGGGAFSDFSGRFLDDQVSDCITAACGHSIM